MGQIKLIHENTDIASLNMTKLNWDAEIHGKPYQVVRIEGYVHSIGGRWGENDYWCYPLREEPTHRNLIEYSGASGGVRWGIRYEQNHYTKCKWDECECNLSEGAMITRNGKDFYYCGGRIGLAKAQYLLGGIIDEHPLSLHERDFDKKAEGMKIWWRSQPAILQRYLGSNDARIVIAPDGIENFVVPAEFQKDEDASSYYEDGVVVTDIFDDNIYWFREDD